MLKFLKLGVIICRSHYNSGYRLTMIVQKWCHLYSTFQRHQAADLALPLNYQGYLYLVAMHHYQGCNGHLVCHSQHWKWKEKFEKSCLQTAIARSSSRWTDTQVVPSRRGVVSDSQAEGWGRGSGLNHNYARRATHCDPQPCGTRLLVEGPF